MCGADPNDTERPTLDERRERVEDRLDEIGERRARVAAGELPDRAERCRACERATQSMERARDAHVAETSHGRHSPTAVMLLSQPNVVDPSSI